MRGSMGGVIFRIKKQTKKKHFLHVKLANLAPRLILSHAAATASKTAIPTLTAGDPCLPLTLLLSFPLPPHTRCFFPCCM